MLNIIDKVLQGNFIVNIAAGVTSALGMQNIYTAAVMTREDIVSLAVTISAVTGAIYGVYRISDLIYKGYYAVKRRYKINRLNKKNNE
jgi:hypothetical protein